MRTSSRFILTLPTLFIIFVTSFGFQASAVEHSGDTTVYWAGKKRVHVVDCRRMPKDPSAIAAMTTMTLAEAQAKGLSLCSRCPGSETSGKGTTEESEEVQKEAESPALNAEDVTVYHAAGKKRAHVADCPRYKRLPQAKKEAMTKMTLKEAQAKGLPLCSRCPGNTQE
jgi:hypothetical protein